MTEKEMEIYMEHQAEDLADYDEQLKEMAKVIKDTWLVDLEGNTYGVCEFLDEVDIESIARELYEKGYKNCKEKIVIDKKSYYELVLAKQSIFDLIEERENKAIIQTFGYIKDFFVGWKDDDTVSKRTMMAYIKEFEKQLGLVKGENK